uniref:Response regulator receiver protein n=1 Tax=uncultured Chloroflexota bacterium TaxID=166587 RepID=H5SDZ0_9CHLR|nr:response regulator receiver protein [uncultured Chloroflexota bacterium]
MAEAKQRILIVEDDLDVAEMLNAYFRVQGYEVQTVNWGEDGVRACLSFHPDLVILDIRLPDIDGFEVARRLREDRRTRNVPIIFLTEKRERADRLQGLSLGADDYITKPFDVQELRLRVRNALRRMSQGSLNNPVSGLPEGALVDERLKEVLNNPSWSVILISLENLSLFREAYGFVAADDVLRAVSLMLTNVLRETGTTDDFLGHLSPTDFVIITPASRLESLKNLIRPRLEQSLDFFYPVRDREAMAQHSNRLAIKIASVASLHGQYRNIDDLKQDLLRLKQ